jgi:hypothetical protein
MSREEDKENASASEEILAAAFGLSGGLKFFMYQILHLSDVSGFEYRLPLLCSVLNLKQDKADHGRPISKTSRFRNHLTNPTNQHNPSQS